MEKRIFGAKDLEFTNLIFFLKNYNPSIDMEYLHRKYIF